MLSSGKNCTRSRETETKSREESMMLYLFLCELDVCFVNEHGRNTAIHKQRSCNAKQAKVQSTSIAATK